MTAPDWTSAQRRAIETVDRSLLVSAAAGSGKTAVLAERCAYLVCDAPAPFRCRVDELLVVTFTETAAAEMRSRIQFALRQRLSADPRNGHVRAELALLDTAQISTIHAFCLWMLRRWFNEAQVDPAAVILDEDETRLLKSETVERLFRDLYDSDAPLAQRFRDLVDTYAIGRDADIAERVLKLADFLASLPPTDDWPSRTRRLLTEGQSIVRDTAAALADELHRQAAHSRTLASTVHRGLPEGRFYGDLLEQHAERLADLRTQLTSGEATDDDDRFERVRAALLEVRLSSKGSPRLKQPSAEVSARRDAGRAMFDEAKALLATRLQKPFGRFTPTQMRQGLDEILPHAETWLELVAEFQDRYRSAKRTMDALDFSDLEQSAFNLLHVTTDGRLAGYSPVSSELRRRFAHVLVDEFQDVNPLQHAILTAASREPDADRSGKGTPTANSSRLGSPNLFAVGDVKQSIYRFRLAEPTIFVERMAEFSQPGARGVSLSLQDNFRSQEPILKGVNLIFRRLMRREASLVEYDELAELRCGCDKQRRIAAPIELHILEAAGGATVGGGEPAETDRNATDDQPRSDGPEGRPTGSPWNDPSTWEGSEREAYLIGCEIRQIAKNARLANGEPPAYRDMAILLRSAAHRAGPMAAVLSRMGIPAYTSVGHTLFETIEVQDVLALLNVLDNPQQDIPLAAVLGSGITGMSLSPDDLVEIRSLDRGVPFHEAVWRYAREGADANVRSRLGNMLDWIDGVRDRIHRRPLADVLWGVFTETGYLAYVGGLERGLQRRANLLHLHERARQFGTFRKQGLHRFLRFIESLQRERRELGAAPAIGEGEDVVRIMSVHQSKGLEFPIVFVAGLGTRFNLEDLRGRMIFDRQAGLGLRVVDREKMVEYPSCAHQRVARQIEWSARDEELRVLYVAMTRARERLVLVGTGRVDPMLRVDGRPVRTELTAIDVLTAQTALDWILLSLTVAREGEVAWPDAITAATPTALFRVHTHSGAEIGSWQLQPVEVAAAKNLRQAAAQLEALPDSEPRAAEPALADDIVARLHWHYPHLSAASVRAVVSASEFKRPLDYQVDADVDNLLLRPREPTGRAAGGGEHAALRGTVTHRVLQHLDLGRVSDVSSICAQMAAMQREGRLGPGEAELVDVDAIAWFFTTSLGRSLAAPGAAYVREFMFISAEPADVIDPGVAGWCDEQVVVRGVIDGVLVTDAGLHVIDFKTDRVDADHVSVVAEQYATQLERYARAATRHWRRDVIARSLVFLHARRMVELPSAAVAGRADALLLH